MFIAHAAVPTRRPNRLRRISLLALVGLAPMAGMVVAGAPIAAADTGANCSNGTCTVTFTYNGTGAGTGTGEPATWVVPAGVTTATFTVDGAAGGSDPGYVAGGAGAEVEATGNVTSGDQYTIRVGGAGGAPNILSGFLGPSNTYGFNGDLLGSNGGFNGGGSGAYGGQYPNIGGAGNGGGGGGASDVYLGNTAIAVAAGGGGGGGNGDLYYGGAGGSAGLNGVAGDPGAPGGGGGGLSGAVGGGYGTGGTGGGYGGYGGYDGGTVLGGGGGMGTTAPPGVHSDNQSYTASGGGGGGGGGYVGGGGGGGGRSDDGTGGGGGGGGANHVNTEWATNSSTTGAWTGTNGQVTISYPDAVAPATQLATLGTLVQGVGPGTSLADKIANAQTYLAGGDTLNTCITLTGFIHTVQAQTGKTVNGTLAGKLIGDGTLVRTELHC